MDIITQLTETQKQTEAFFVLPETDLQKTYAPGKWSVRKILVHLSDTEGILHERIKRIIAEPKQVIWAFDQDLWCNNLNYESYPLEISKPLFSANRPSIIFLANNFTTRWAIKNLFTAKQDCGRLKMKLTRLLITTRHICNKLSRVKIIIRPGKRAARRAYAPPSYRTRFGISIIFC